jgi:hypothetical protein
MILRKEENLLIDTDIGNRTEDQFIELNPGFIKVDTLPYSASGYYTYDEDHNIIVDNTKELEQLKMEKMEEVLIHFDELMFHGIFDCSLGFRADNRRGDGKDDKDNIQSLIDLGNEPVYFKDADNQFHSLTLEELHTLKQEMIQDGLSKYQWKWNKENEVMSAETIEDLNAVIV